MSIINYLKGIVRNNTFLYSSYEFLRFNLILKSIYILDRLILYPLIRKRKLRNQLISVNKLNVGYGDIPIKGWLNIYLDQHTLYGLSKRDNNTLVLNFDMTNELPLSKNSIQYIYASHFIEHLTFEEGITFIERSYKFMKKGGVIRITCPDMGLWIKKYKTNDKIFFKKYKNLALGGKSLAKTNGEIFMSQVHGWGHKWNYDYDSLKHILEKAGFRNITKKIVFESSIPDIKKIEPHNELRFLETIYVEARK